jgi:hypothetical protein
MVDVVGESHVDATRGRARHRVANDRRDRVGQTDVVDRDLQRAVRRRDPLCERARDLLRRLAAVGERTER